MNNIILTAFQNKYPLNSFKFIAFKIMKITILDIDIINMHIVYHWILQVHSASCITETCSYLVTASTSPYYYKARLITKDFNLACLHIMYRIIEVTANEIMAVTNRKMSIV